MNTEKNKNLLKSAKPLPVQIQQQQKQEVQLQQSPTI